jgi:hypothetical protein
MVNESGASGRGRMEFERTKGGNEALATLTRKAIKAIQSDAREAYQELAKSYEGSAVVFGVFGLGSVTIAVRDGEIQVGSDGKERSKLVGRGAVYPETLLAITRGEITPLEAYHRGELLARAASTDLHRAYGHLMKFSDAALRSPKLQEVVSDFREVTGL